MPTQKPPHRQRLSVTVLAPRVRLGVAVVRKTMLPPQPHERLKRMGAAVVVLAGLGAAAYAGTGSAAWAVLLLVVGVPVGVLPVMLIVGMVMEARANAAEP